MNGKTYVSERPMMKSHFRLPITILLALVLVGCSSQPASTTTTPARDATQLPPSITPSLIPTRTQSIASPTRTPLPAVTPTRNIEKQFCSPLAETPLADLAEIVSQPFKPPAPHHEDGHHGVDLAYYRRGGRSSILGEGVQSVFSGRVAAAVQDRFPYGNMVIVETAREELPEGLAEWLEVRAGKSLYVLFAHLEDAPRVALGDAVDACQRLGEVGKSGNAAVAHLHLEMRIGPAGQQFTGMAYYFTHATNDERASYVRWRTSGEFSLIDPMDVLAPGRNH